MFLMSLVALSIQCTKNFLLPVQTLLNTLKTNQNPSEPDFMRLVNTSEFLSYVKLSLPCVTDFPKVYKSLHSKCKAEISHLAFRKKAWMLPTRSTLILLLHTLMGLALKPRTLRTLLALEYISNIHNWDNPLHPNCMKYGAYSSHMVKKSLSCGARPTVALEGTKTLTVLRVTPVIYFIL